MSRLFSVTLLAASLGWACSSSCATPAPAPTSASTPAPTSGPEAGQATQGSCLDPSAMSKERYEQLRAQLQANHYERDAAAEKAMSAQTGKTVECYRPGGSAGPGLGFDAPTGWTQPQATDGANGWMNPRGTAALQYSLTGPLTELPENFTDADLLRVVERFASTGLRLPPPTKTDTGSTKAGLRYAGGMFSHPEAGTMWLWAVTDRRGPTIWVTLTGNSDPEDLAAAHRFLSSLRLE